jgi:hypothetical protein
LASLSSSTTCGGWRTAARWNSSVSGGADVGRAVGEAVASGQPVYLDSLDEALLTEPALLNKMNWDYPAIKSGSIGISPEVI